MLTPTGFGDGQHALNKQTSMVRLSAMRSPSPDDRMPEGAFGGIVGGFDASGSNKRPERRIQRDQATAGFGSAILGTEQALGQPMTDRTLDGRELGQERLIR